ncbi:uncharacterized protein LOC126368082 [Pectinophora gossypiella]|uniref:uncharacterized protein LOC126368082 n=1 Tax=Pectinophora gossypiella TaxID=13191 RepID=UPI00214DF491|nr:uncharacterized protein LOC126368082 [Pectinophora gossypiella]
MTLSSITLGDVVSGAVFSGSKKVDMDAVLPFMILPLLLITATTSFTVTVIVMVVIAMGTLYVLSRPRAKNRSPFFFSWTLSSGVTMYLVYQIHVLKSYQITMLENFGFLMFTLCTGYFFYRLKAVAEYELTGASKGKDYSPVLTSDSHYCPICQIEVNEKFFHSIWWDCCVFRPNYSYFLVGQVFALITLLYGTNLGLTFACHPFVFYGNILLPESCDHVYEYYNSAIVFVTCIYGLGYALVIILVLIHQLMVYIPKYTELQWRKYVNVLNV